MNARKWGEGKTPHRTIRVEDELWNAARERAEAEGSNLTAVITDALRKYVAKRREKKEEVKGDG